MRVVLPQIIGWKKDEEPEIEDIEINLDKLLWSKPKNTWHWKTWNKEKDTYEHFTTLYDYVIMGLTDKNYFNIALPFDEYLVKTRETNQSIDE
jgi:hypothetical protein